MFVDLDKDIRRLSETKKRVRALSEPCALALGIVKDAQLCVRNNLKLQSLAHFTARYLIKIAECLNRRPIAWSTTVAAKLQGLIDELKRVLREISNAIQRYSRLYLEASVGVTERDNDIDKLEKSLQEIQGSIFSLRGYNDITGIISSPEETVSYVGVTVRRPQSVANSRHRSGHNIIRPETTTAPQRSEFATRTLPHGDLKGYPFPLFGGLEQVITSSSNAPEASFGLSGSAFSRVESPHKGAPDRPPSRGILSRLRRRSAPDLTESIRDIRHTSFGGGYGDIYSGVLTTSHGPERVAMKLLKVVNEKTQIEKTKKKFRREVDIWRFLVHPNVLSFYGTSRYEFDETRFYMVSPWAERGKSLDYFQRHPNANRGVLLRQTAFALEYLHSGKDVPPVIHGDVKADNVLISQAGQALLCDFGLSFYAEEGISSESPDANGTVRFMAPELLIDHASTPASSKPTKESDVYAFGSLMIQIYTGQLPFSDVPDPMALLKVARREVPTRPTDPVVVKRGLNDRIWTLMNDCWRPDPSHRPRMDEIIWKLNWDLELR